MSPARRWPLRYGESSRFVAVDAGINAIRNGFLRKPRLRPRARAPRRCAGLADHDRRRAPPASRFWFLSSRVARDVQHANGLAVHFSNGEIRCPGRSRLFPVQATAEIPPHTHPVNQCPIQIPTVEMSPTPDIANDHPIAAVTGQSSITPAVVGQAAGLGELDLAADLADGTIVFFHPRFQGSASEGWAASTFKASVTSACSAQSITRPRATGPGCFLAISAICSGSTTCRLPLVRWSAPPAYDAHIRCAYPTEIAPGSKTAPTCHRCRRIRG